MNKIARLIVKDSTLVPIVSILIGLLLGAIVMLIGSYNPILAYASLFEYVFGSMNSIGEMIRQMTPLIFTGLAVAFAFRTGLFNIGAEGQFMMGMLGATFVGVTFQMPWFLHVPLALIVGGVMGGLWGVIAGYLKAQRGVHEVISTIMLNWIALYLGNYIVKKFFLEPNQMRSKYIADSSWLNSSTVTSWFDGARIHFGILIAIALAVVFYIVLWRTKQGYELRAVGINPHASEYAGVNVKANIVKAMFYSGIFAGVGGVCEILGVFHYQAVNSAFPGYGMLGIAVALIGRNSAIGTVLGALLLAVFTYGAAGIKFGAGVPEELINIVVAIVIFFVAASEMVKLLLRFKKRKE
ncbi:ABC transporter permease [Paenibacillus albiflavus]|uniref:ABC transporter permease n=1 Tax=Paenibacillus albiflavus TaxID=2545760 RepID=A0A4V2WNI2_9BACL|nr:ABC transporter permease [Paenibacillus albiflavus]TCZ75602.1 ABC transporter permease [Paenibacillus albiflavus]